MVALFVRPTARLRGVYHGWWIVAAWVVLNVYWSGTLVYGLTVFFTPVRLSFGWSAALLALVFSLANVINGLLAPASGTWFDRAGPRPLMLTACVCSGAGLAALGQTRSFASFVLAYSLVSAGYALWSGTGMATVGHWFVRRRGLAMGIVVAGSSLGGLLVPVWQLLVDAAGWRSGFLVAGAGMLVVGTGASSVLRHRPADLGLLPDGGTERSSPPGERVAANGVLTTGSLVVGRMDDGDAGFWTALRTVQFWALAGVVSVILAGSTAATVLLLPWLRDAGVSPGRAATAATVAILLGVVGRPMTGLLADRVPVSILAAGIFVVQAAGLLAFALVPRHPFWLVVFVIGFGLSNDTVRMLASLQLLRYFGPRVFGRVLGAQQTVLIPARVLGPVIAGVFHDTGRGYGAAFVLFAAASVLVVPPMLLMRSPAARAT